MCGIVGFLARSESMRGTLGEAVLPMFDFMADRGPDSAGFALFGDRLKGELRRFNIYSPRRDHDWQAFRVGFETENQTKGSIQAVENHAILVTDLPPAKVTAWVTKHDPTLRVLSVGKSIDLYKDVGHPLQVMDRYKLGAMRGTHLIGHTRMATESAVTPAHCHPFTAGEDMCLVHNGSLSNPYSLRRKLEKRGIRFETDNDTEAACRFIEWRMREGDTLEQAIGVGFAEFDGFYTLLIATEKKLVLVRDAFACKPAVVAESDDYVAVASEFRSLAHLPGVARARIFEPKPETMYSWTI